MSDAVRDEFMRWILSQELSGYAIRQEGEDRIAIEGEAATGQVNFYVLDDGGHVAELHVAPIGADENTGSFYLHFMLEDLARAQELFGEMAETLAEAVASEEVPVLLCCSCGITTNLMANRMNEVSKTLGLDYAFSAKSLDAAKEAGERYAAVMLAPQVAHLRSELVAAFPDTPVFEIPGKIFGAYDAPGAVRLAVEVVEQRRTGSGEGLQETHTLPRFEELRWNGRILVISTVYAARSSSVEYRIYEAGELLTSGQTTSRTFDFRAVEEVFATLQVRGVNVRSLDAVGIAIPGIIKGGSVSFLAKGIHDYELADHIEQTYGVQAFLDNDANAAAVGCYTTQDRYKSIVYHRESYGDAGCGQGSVVKGDIVEGRANFAGELTHLTGAFALSGEPKEIAWTEEGMYELVSRFLLANICVLSPEAIYVDAWPVTDMERLRDKLRAYADDPYLPELIPAPDFNEAIFTGELALCVRRLRRQQPRANGAMDFFTAYLLNK